jgi:kynurenine formamidase
MQVYVRIRSTISSTWPADTISASSAATALTAANAFVSLGLKAVGYEYINTDDTWSNMTRAANGTLVPDLNKWPNGIAVVAAEIHSMGLKMGEFYIHFLRRLQLT